MDTMDELTLKYLARVERIEGYPMAGAGRARVLAEVAAIDQAERARVTARLLPAAGPFAFLPSQRRPDRFVG